MVLTLQNLKLGGNLEYSRSVPVIVDESFFDKYFAEKLKVPTII
jgi:hypothetical protein